MRVKLLTEQCLELLSLTGGCTGLSKYYNDGNHVSRLNLKKKNYGFVSQQFIRVSNGLDPFCP